MGRILRILEPKFRKAFPETKGDAYDFVIPPTSFGAWLKNQRMRQALRLKELAALLKVSAYSVIRYESDQSRPAPAILKRIHQLLGPHPLHCVTNRQ